MIACANAWIEAFNTKNVTLLLSLYHPNAQHLSPKLRLLKPESFGLITGHKAQKHGEADSNIVELLEFRDSLIIKSRVFVG